MFCCFTSHPEKGNVQQVINYCFVKQITLLKMTNKNKILTNNQSYTITIEGSLGLLAYGDIGLRAWREVKNNNNINKIDNHVK
ncbi:hypothetical protein [Psychroserpens damuponensis]|uniref:hypothetical protein n=1 Tax=Psychroserpens damuponensis TaxID=943936 RepID=UPI00058F2C50|nr:hypothetical protein [Psychroserpens damuponensis]